MVQMFSSGSEPQTVLDCIPAGSWFWWKRLHLLLQPFGEEEQESVLLFWTFIVRTGVVPAAFGSPQPSAGQEVGAGLVPVDSAASPELSFAGQSQVVSRVGVGGVGGVVVLLQVLLEDAVIRELLLQREATVMEGTMRRFI